MEATGRPEAMEAKGDRASPISAKAEMVAISADGMRMRTAQRAMLAAVAVAADTGVHGVAVAQATAATVWWWGAMQPMAVQQAAVAAAGAAD